MEAKLYQLGQQVELLRDRSIACKTIIEAMQIDIFTDDEINNMKKLYEETNNLYTRRATEFRDKMTLYETRIKNVQNLIESRVNAIDTVYSTCEELRCNEDLMDVFKPHHEALTQQLDDTKQLL